MPPTPQPPTHAERAAYKDAQNAADAQNYRDILNTIIAQAADMARFVHDEAQRHAEAATTPPTAKAPEQPGETPRTPIASLATAFDQVARTLRRTILLTKTITDPRPAAADPAAQRATAHAAARRQIIRNVEDAIDRHAEGRHEARTGALRAELAERLDAPELAPILADDIETRPIADIVAEICRDLGLVRIPGTRPWPRRTPEHIRTLCEQAANDPALRNPNPHNEPGSPALRRLTALLGPLPPERRSG